MTSCNPAYSLLFLLSAFIGVNWLNNLLEISRERSSTHNGLVFFSNVFMFDSDNRLHAIDLKCIDLLKKTRTRAIIDFKWCV